MFCKRCKSVLIPVKRGDKMVCKSCGEPVGDAKPLAKEKGKVKMMEVADSKNTLAVHDHVCSKCGYGKAQIIEKGIWYSDEDSVIIYKCGRCGHSEMGEGKIQ